MDIGKTRFRMVKERHKQSLEKAVAEKKADEKVLPVCRILEKSKDFFTSSSCSGRIILLSMKDSENKKDAKFFKKWHRRVGFEELWKALHEESKHNLWFKLEPFVFLIGCNTSENAMKIIRACRKCGIKRAGINFWKEGKYLVEVMGTQYMSFQAKEGNKVLAEEGFMRFQLEKANKKLEKNFEKLEEFGQALKEAVQRKKKE